MLQFDVYSLKDTGAPVVIVQNDLLEEAKSRVVVPLLSPDAKGVPFSRLNPEVTLDGSPFILATEFISTLTIYDLDKQLGNIATSRDQIVSAIDFLFLGF